MTTSSGARIAPSPAEMARADYGVIFAGVPLDGPQLDEVARIPGFMRARREARRHLALRATADAAA